jgi:hypothetical protein
MRYLRDPRDVILAVARTAQICDVTARPMRPVERRGVDDDRPKRCDGRPAIVSTGIKVWVQMELARWAVLTGKPALEGFAHAPPRIGRAAASSAARWPRSASFTPSSASRSRRRR